MMDEVVQQGSHFFYLVKFPDFSLTFPWFPKSFPWFFLTFHQDILLKKTYLFFLNVALVTLVYANIASLSAISWRLLRFNSLKKHFPQIFWFKRFENGLGKKFPDLKFFSLILAENPVFPWFPWLEKVFKIFPEFPDFPDRWEPCSTISAVKSVQVNGIYTGKCWKIVLWKFVPIQKA